jgi:hypothetical protein
MRVHRPVSFGELYTALSTGVVDGPDNLISVFNLIKLYELQSHLHLTGHTCAFGPTGISEVFYLGLNVPRKLACDRGVGNRIGERKRCGGDQARRSRAQRVR